MSKSFAGIYRMGSGMAIVSLMAVFLAGQSAAFTAGSATQSEDSLAYGTGIMVNAGYFFKDTMFYSKGRGGLHVDGGKAFPLGGKFGLWVGAGAMQAKGTMRAYDHDSFRYDTRFEAKIVHADIGILTPWTPFPLGIMIYQHRTDLDDSALDGPLAGGRFSGSSSGIGWGFTVHLLFEWFPWGADSVSRRGPGLVFGYMGLIDMKKINIPVRDGLGRELVHQGWSPAAGESLRAGIEWEF